MIENRLKLHILEHDYEKYRRILFRDYFPFISAEYRSRRGASISAAAAWSGATTPSTAMYEPFVFLTCGAFGDLALWVFDFLGLGAKLQRKITVQSFKPMALPKWVADEIAVKHDEPHTEVQKYLASHHLEVKQSTLKSLVDRLHQRLGKGESEAIALAIELQADYVLLDDAAARKEAMRLGLNVKDTLGVIRKLQQQGTIHIDDLGELYQQLVAIHFRVKCHIFDEIFRP